MVALATAISAASSALSTQAAPPAVGSAVACRAPIFESSALLISGTTVPVSMWLPADCAEGSTTARTTPDGSLPPTSTVVYPYRIDVGRIAARLGVRWLTWLPARDVDIVRELPTPAAPARGCAVLFAHGYLGSRFDMAHACERLAALGFFVAAPDLPETISGSFEPSEATTRAAIMEETRALLARRAAEAGVVCSRYGIFGHSAGAGTATTLPGSFALGRVALCGYRGYAGADPLLVMASAGDGVIPLNFIRAALESDASRGQPASIRALPAERALPTSARVAMLYPTPEGTPTHISFLFKETNDAMVDFLSFFLPLARALRVPLLDFDRYKLADDAEHTADTVVPLLESFFSKHADLA